MKKETTNLSKEEQELLDSTEAGEWRSVKDLRKEMLRAQEIARKTLSTH